MPPHVLILRFERDRRHIDGDRKRAARTAFANELRSLRAIRFERQWLRICSPGSHAAARFRAAGVLPVDRLRNPNQVVRLINGKGSAARLVEVVKTGRRAYLLERCIVDARAEPLKMVTMSDTSRSIAPARCDV